MQIIATGHSHNFGESVHSVTHPPIHTKDFFADESPVLFIRQLNHFFHFMVTFYSLPLPNVNTSSVGRPVPVTCPDSIHWFRSVPVPGAQQNRLPGCSQQLSLSNWIAGVWTLEGIQRFYSQLIIPRCLSANVGRQTM